MFSLFGLTNMMIFNDMFDVDSIEDLEEVSKTLCLPKKYKLRFGDVNPSLNQGEDIFPLHKYTVLLKETGLYCFLLDCKKPEAEPFMEWVVETVLTREVRKLASVI